MKSLLRMNLLFYNHMSIILDLQDWLKRDVGLGNPKNNSSSK